MYFLVPTSEVQCGLALASSPAGRECGVVRIGSAPWTGRTMCLCGGKREVGGQAGARERIPGVRLKGAGLLARLCQHQSLLSSSLHRTRVKGELLRS